MQAFSALLQQAESIVAFTGAGISTESGIPHFRSPGGIWSKYQPINFQDFMASEEMRRESWRRKFASQQVISEAQPNSGHMALARLQQSGKLKAVITQNIDGLHQRSGIPDELVVELHGNSTYAHCLDCGQRMVLDTVAKIFAVVETLPMCTHCNGIIKTATVSFGQMMPEREMLQAEQFTLQADLFIAIGSSLVVQPAAGFPVIAKQNGAQLVILNRDPTPLDEYADLVLSEEIGDCPSQACNTLLPN